MASSLEIAEPVEAALSGACYSSGPEGRAGRHCPQAFCGSGVSAALSVYSWQSCLRARRPVTTTRRAVTLGRIETKKKALSNASSSAQRITERAKLLARSTGGDNFVFVKIVRLNVSVSVLAGAECNSSPPHSPIPQQDLPDRCVVSLEKKCAILCTFWSGC